MHEVLGFAEDAFSDERLKNALQALARSYIDTKSKGGFLLNLVEHELDTCVQLTIDAAKDHAEVEQTYLATYARDLIKTAKGGDEVVTTSFVQTHAFWDSPWVAEYVKENEAAVQRGVNVTRIFIFFNDEALQDSIKQMNYQVGKGITVKTVLTTELEPDLSRDLFLLKGHIAAEYILTPDREHLRKLELWTSPPKLNEMTDIINRLVDKSRIYP